MAAHRAPKARLTNMGSVGEFFSSPKRNVFGSPVFGQPLDPRSREVPPALVFIISYLESKALNTPGLLNGNPKYDEVLLCTIKMESGEVADHSDIQNPLVMMEVLKLYLRDLPEPLFTYQLYEPLMAINEALADASDIEIPQHLGYLKDLLRTLPYVNQLVVCYLISFFSWLASNAETTKTSHINLGGIFGPYFLRPQGISGDYTTADAVSLLSVLIARAGQLLPSLDGYSESLALLNLQTPAAPADGTPTRGKKDKSKDPFASMRPGKRKTPATIRVKNFEFDDEPIGEAGGKVGLVTAPPEYAVELPRREPLKGPFKLIDAEVYEPLFQQNLAGKDQIVYVALDVEFGPLVLCQEKTPAKDSIRCILFHSYGTESISAPPNCKKMSEMVKFVRVLYPNIPPQMKFSELHDPSMPNELGNYERKNMSKGAKFGLLFRRAGQTSEDDMFANNDINHKGWQEFLLFLGDKIELTGFEGFRGGLDTKNRTTGTHSLYTKFGKTEIMFHVAPLLPWYPNDKQQLERKRHIGNDLAVIIFQEDESEFNPTWLTSEMNHVFIVLTAVKEGYKMAIVTKKAVRTVEPHLSDPPIIPKNQLGREFFLSKLINVERSTLHAPVFEKKLARTRRMLLENLIGESYSRRKAKMPKASRPEGARKSLLPQIASLQRAKRASTSDVSDAKAMSEKLEATNPKPAISEPSLVSVTHSSPMPEEGEDLLTMASSKHVKKALAKRVDALYRDTDVTLMMARDLADADEEELAAGIAATPQETVPQTTAVAVPIAKLQVEGRQRALSDSPMPKGHMRRPSNAPAASSEALHTEAKRRVAEIVTRLNGYVDTCCKREMMERTMTLSKVLKACNDIVDQNVQEYNTALLPQPTKLPEAVGVSLPQLKETCKKAVSQFSDKLSGLITVTFKVNNSADCVSLTKNVYVLEMLLAAYDSSPDSLKDLPVDKPIRDPARELAAAMTGAPPPALAKRHPHRTSGSHNTDTSGVSPVSGSPPATPATPSKHHDRGHDHHHHHEHHASVPPSTPSKKTPTPDEPPRPSESTLSKSDSDKGIKTPQRPVSTNAGAGPPATLTRSLTDLRMVQQRLLQAMQRTQWKLTCLHRLFRDGQLSAANAMQILSQFPIHDPLLKSFLDAVSMFHTLRKELNETLSLGDVSQAQLRLVEATKATKVANSALDNWFAAHPFDAPTNITELADEAMRLCNERFVRLSDAMLKTGVSAVANRCTRLFRLMTKFLTTQEELPIIPPVEISGALMNEAQSHALAELMNFLTAEAQSKLHALVHHIRGSSSDPNRKWEAVTQLEALERVAALLETEIQALTSPPSRPLPAPPPSTVQGISDEELERLRTTLSHSAELTENSIAAVESLTRQCQSLQLATALAALAVVLKKLRSGEQNLNLKAVRVESTADAGTLTPEQLTKLEYIRKLATTVFADTRVFMLTMSAEIASSNATPTLLAHAKLVANFKKALDDFETTNADHCLRAVTL